MSASTYVHPEWLWDSERGLWYFHPQNNPARVFWDQQHDQLIYENGQRIPRSPLLALPTATDRQTLRYPTSPTQESAYGLSSAVSYSSSQDVDTLSRGLDAVTFREDPPPLNVPIPAAPRSGSAISQTPRHAARYQPHVYLQNNMRIISTQNDVGVRTVYADRPPEQITDPELYVRGVRAQRLLMRTPGEDEPLYPTFKLQKPTFWYVGRVVQTLWSEPAGESFTTVTSFEPTEALKSNVFTGRHGERVYSKVRRFVIVRVGNQHSTAVPIMSYGHQGVGKTGVTKSDHAIIFTGTEAPQELYSERPRKNEEPMRFRSIRVIPDVPTDALDTMSRINFAKVHTIEHNLKVKSWGNVWPPHMEALTSQFFNVVFGPSAITSTNAQAGPSNLPRQRVGSGGSFASKPAAGPSKVSMAMASQQAGDDEVDEDNEEEDDEEEDDNDNDEGEEDAGQQTPNVDQQAQIISRLMRQGYTSQQATTEATTALQLHNAYTRLLAHRYTSAQALNYLSSRMQHSANISPEDAKPLIVARLAYYGVHIEE